MDDFLLSALYLTSTIIRFSSNKNEVISDCTVVDLRHLTELLCGSRALDGLALYAWPSSCCSRSLCLAKLCCLAKPSEFVLGIVDIKFMVLASCFRDDK